MLWGDDNNTKKVYRKCSTGKNTGIILTKTGLYGLLLNFCFGRIFCYIRNGLHLFNLYSFPVSLGQIYFVLILHWPQLITTQDTYIQKSEMDISRTACMALSGSNRLVPKNPLDKWILKKKTERGEGVACTPALPLYVRGLRRGRSPTKKRLGNRWFNFLNKAAFRAMG